MGGAYTSQSLQNNRLTGPIPTSINNASLFQVLILQSNSFSAPIPTFANLNLLSMFVLSDKQSIKSSTHDMQFLTSLTNSPYLNIIDISNNPLRGVLPNSIGNLSQSLELFRAYGTGIRGSIPSQIGNLINLTALNLRDNQLNGSIPSTIGNLKKLGGLFLAHNQLQGSIPIDLCMMSSLAEQQPAERSNTGMLG
ncbi:probable LRR receptor-like serine/threonine-protein kinase At3g47570 [Salvia splendens]|uniref:probable LRR receptor-like serine/threonine-protein kinase At3g47570 n=1 Tax=Salvia splendens TaxID=180675 RepID=UPI001C2745E2|nr:probable LRR receptor-like serine/threonine-protein kinase At3g47570 [Salvia splendens]